MKAVLLRAGMDKCCCSQVSPIFEDGSFEFIPIPELYAPRPSLTMCSQKRGRHGQMPSTYLPTKFHNLYIHDDPEFTTYTYGDPTSKGGLFASSKLGMYSSFMRDSSHFKTMHSRRRYISLGISQSVKSLTSIDYQAMKLRSAIDDLLITLT